MTCSNPSRPCGLHDKNPELYIPFAGYQVHWGWWIAALVVIIGASIWIG